jgi:hypothetical protein
MMGSSRAALRVAASWLPVIRQKECHRALLMEWDRDFWVSSAGFVALSLPVITALKPSSAESHTSLFHAI